MAIAYVQSAQNSGTTSCTLTLTVSAGSLLVVGARSSGGTGLTITVSDGVNTWSLARNQDQTIDASTLTIKYAMNVASGSTTATVTGFSGGTVRAAMAEYSGIATSSALDQVNSGQANGNAPSSGNITTTVADELLFATVESSTDAGAISSTSSFNIRQTVSPNRFVIADLIVVATGTYSADFSMASAADHATAVASFKIASGGGGGRVHRASPLDGLGGVGQQRFNPSLSYHRHPVLSLDAYRREQARKHRAFLDAVRRVA